MSVGCGSNGTPTPGTTSVSTIPVIRPSPVLTVRYPSWSRAMTDFRGYLCWEPAVSEGALNTEAVVASPAVFVATHTPLRIRRAQIRGRSLTLMEGTTDENAVLSDFLNRKPDTGTLLMPIVGDTGTGKSHLVRWVRNNIPQCDDQCVIYLEK